RQVGDEVHVAVTLLPARELVPGDRLHLHVDGQQVVARVRAFACDDVEEEAGVEALAGEPAVRVGEAGDDGVDVARLDQAGELVEVDHRASAGAAGGTACWPSIMSAITAFMNSSASLVIPPVTPP